MKLTYNGTIFKSEQTVVALIEGHRVLGQLYYNKRDDNWYLLHNTERYDGDISPKKFKYKYSWGFYVNDDESLSSGVELLTKAEHLKYIFEITTLLDSFMTRRFDASYLVKDNILADIVEIKMCDTPGLITLINQKEKSTDIKFGRFLTAYKNEVEKVYGIDMEIDSKKVEKIHNEYIKFQKDKDVTIEYLSGEALLQGYETENYHAIKGRLGGSCMNNKPEFLQMYTQNPDIVQLVVLKLYDKVIGRALLWQTDKGPMLDSEYTTDDWVYAIFEQLRVSEKYLHYYAPYASENVMSVTMNLEGLTKYPYLDTLMLLLPDGKTMVNYIYDMDKFPPGCKRFRATNGNCEIV